jgi:VWFA-related protein
VHIGAAADLRVDSRLVLVPVSVTDARNHPITGLPKDAFRLFDGKTEQSVLHFASEDQPLSIGIVFDSSGSMKDKKAQAGEAVGRFLETANPEDEFFLVDFAGTARVASPFTRETGEIRNRLLFTGSEGKTALLDAVCLALDYMKKASHPRRALLIISDGGDNDSRFTQIEIRKRVLEADVWVYAIGVYNQGAVMLPEEEQNGSVLLSALAEAGGGRHFAVRRIAELPEAAAQIGLSLRSQYVLGYRPGVAWAGQYHRVRVKLVDGRGLRVTSRGGYYDPE